jgi:TolB-like protein/Tfp pilus assembly protein PilF
MSFAHDFCLLARTHPRVEGVRHRSHLPKTLVGEAAVNVQRFFAELKRRNVYRAAIGYAVVGWLLIQVATQVLPFFEISNWRIRVIVLLIVLGFPVVLIIAWAFDLTPEGLKRTELAADVPSEPSRSRIWIYLITVSLALSVGLFFVGRYTALRQAGTLTLSAKSIAVLPFENLSRDPDNAYFADGVQDEILSNLAHIADLKVIGRTSVMQYKAGVARDLREIGRQLAVANVLEGSVQRAGDRVRVIAQLVDARTHRQLWGQTYDRDLADVFTIQSDIAKTIASQLQAKLTGREEQTLAVRPTSNTEAYDAYLRGLAFDARSAYSNDALRKAIALYERAVQLDPTFAVAWARLSRADASLYFVRADQTAARRDAAKRALDNAQRLQPNSAETLLALGYYQYWVLRDYGAAKTTFELARKLLPGSSDVPYALGLVTRRQGNWHESIDYFEQGLALDPRNWELLSNTAWTYAMLRQFPAALKLYDRALDISPNDPDLIAVKAAIYQAQGNLPEAATVLSQIDAQTPNQNAFIIKMTQLRLERNHAEASRSLQARLAQFPSAPEIDNGTTQVLLAFAQRLAGDAAGAKDTADQARKTLEPLCKQQPDNSFFAQQLSLANAALGNKDAALKEAERAITLLPTARDPLSAPTREEVLALIQMMFGESSRPISTLSRLLQTPYISWLYGPMPATSALLKLDPIWNPLRSDPAFQKLCEEKQP